MKVCGLDDYQVSYETDRSKFIGRGRTLVHPQILDQAHMLSNTQGSVLDPIISIQYKIMLEPGQSAIIDMVTGAGDTREINEMLIDKYQDKQLRDRAFELSWTHSQVVLRQIGSTEADAQLYGKLASSILYLNPALRAHPATIQKNRLGQSSLWSYSMSGDIPIILVQITDHNNVWLVKQLIKAQAYWHMNGLAVDVFIINEDPGAYRQILQDQIQGMIAAGVGAPAQEKRGRIFIRPTDQISDEDRILLETVARVIISDTRGTLESQVNKRAIAKSTIPKLIAVKSVPTLMPKLQVPTDLQFFNSLGGFSSDGKEYIIITDEKKKTPLPWINVMANSQFGTIMSESGSSYTWFQNAHEYRLTPWRNDSVQDGSGEAFYLRDEESARFWSPLGSSGSGQGQYITHHGFGYSKFHHSEAGIISETSVHVDKDFPVKFIVIKITNRSGRARKLSVTGYVEWVLGELRSKSILHNITELNAGCGALMARNNYNTEFQNYVSFFDVDHSGYTYTTDRTEFIGRNGSLQNPDAMGRTHLSGRSGAGLDACAALQVQFTLENEMEHTVTFMLGAGKDMDEAVNTVKHFQGNVVVADSLKHIHHFWNNTLSAVQIDTPDPAINMLANGWLIYQVLSCRLWGRTGLYQSGGAFGFRDQLQDVLALIHTQPDLTKKQILLCASRQFIEGDVQHWWHPPTGRGVRTHFSDDLIWLPFVVSYYVKVTGDYSILEEKVPFIEAPLLAPGQDDSYTHPQTSEEVGTIFEHCARSLDRSLKVGSHGLPLMGAGDWNDGMSRVGHEGRGESVWVAWFLSSTLQKFLPFCERMQASDRVAAYSAHLTHLKTAVEENAWDGDWYRRAYFDDGTPLGSALNEECRIDSISQSWSVLSGAADKARSIRAMAAVNEYLIRKGDGLIQLFTPAFDKTSLDPGYIKGYLPGVRENGGQYTHAAIWTLMAYAELDDGEQATELYALLNPINHASTRAGMHKYKVEPYVVAADIYGAFPHVGRGGWTWYTGSASWMYRAALESILGFEVRGHEFRLNPKIPLSWPGFEINYRLGQGQYHIGLVRDIVGDYKINEWIPLLNDGKEHKIRIGL